MKIYTRKGDTGTTSLQSGVRVNKTDPRIIACGSLDELNAHIGLLLCDTHLPDETNHTLLLCQSDLFCIGAWISSCNNTNTSTQYLAKIDDSRLELSIDEMEKQLPPLTHFILPGGTAASCQAHICRTVCRRAEVSVFAAQMNMAGITTVTAYLNRLSDYLFVLSRLLNHNAGQPETEWQG